MELVPRERLVAAAAMAGADPSEVPPSAQHVEAQCASWGLSVQLKPHQAQGVSWLVNCYLRGINVILGDEVRSFYSTPYLFMGLGKTLQAIALISFLKFERNVSGPFLILCPLSVIDGWSMEFQQRASKLHVLRYIGNKDERALLSKKICDFVNSQSPSSWEDPKLPFDVLLTTYDLAMLDVGFLSRFRWRYGIMDEAQRLKNFSAVYSRMNIFFKGRGMSQNEKQVVQMTSR
ncbi:hypothetical protein L7F22_039637 [Adiantum nelumboides]|nr:hypothetical protein [Adiantum nelumboides]